MYERLLVVVDRSEISSRALAAARELASLSDGQVRVLHLREQEATPRMGLIGEESSEEAHLRLDSAVDELRNAGVKATGEVRTTIYSQAAREIAADAELHDAGVIVIGSRGRTDLAGLFHSSTAHKVIHLTGRPVLVIR